MKPAEAVASTPVQITFGKTLVGLQAFISKSFNHRIDLRCIRFREAPGELVGEFEARMFPAREQIHGAAAQRGICGLVAGRFTKLVAGHVAWAVVG